MRFLYIIYQILYRGADFSGGNYTYCFDYHVGMLVG